MSLPDSEEQFRALCACSPVGILLTNVEGNCTYTNPSYQSICGLTLEESLGEGWTRFIHPEDRAQVVSGWAAYMREGEEYFQEFRFQNPHRGVRWIHMHSAPMISEAGRPVGHVRTLEDVTERKEIERALKESESKYRMLMEQASDGIHTYDIEGHIIDANSKLCEMLGYTREELLRLNVSDLIAEEDLAAAPIRFEELRAGKTLINERCVRRKDGTMLWVEVSGKMLSNSVLQAIIRDITERKRTVRLLHAQRQSLEMLVSGASLAEVLTYLTRVVEQQAEGRVTASILMLDEHGCLRNGSSPSLPEHYLKAIDGIRAASNVGTCSAAAALGTVVVTPDIATDPKWQNLKHLPLELGFHAAWSMPIRARDGRVLGTFGTYFRECREPDALERQVVEILARSAALAIERTLVEEALHQAHDELERRVVERTHELESINEVLQAEICERRQSEEARRELLRQLVSFQEDERRRISRELHDKMGQHLAAIVLLVNSLRDFPQSETETHSRFEQLEEVASQLSQEVDTLAWELRPTELDDLGLHHALGNYVAKWSKRSHLPMDFHSAGFAGQRLAPQVETAIYRIAQEALTNIIKHSRASYAGLILERRGQQVSVIIEDDGCGFDVEALSAASDGERRMGLLGMRERAALVGGTLNIESAPGTGTTVFLRVSV